uniref:Transmembrane protein n=1 Tax=Medicago truncatula TaxID=3880 RepID=I3T1A1_MEDTR|nr:unknown [Medicago truncatula]
MFKVLQTMMLKKCPMVLLLQVHHLTKIFTTIFLPLFTTLVNLLLLVTLLP